MSDEKRKQQALRWLETAEQDFEDGRLLKDNKRYAAACFHFRQAGEKALKAAMIASGCDPWGHSLVKMLQEETFSLKTGQRSDLASAARLLDKLYIPTRYPDGLPDMIPSQVFDDADAEAGMKSAKKFLDTAHDFIDRK